MGHRIGLDPNGFDSTLFTLNQCGSGSAEGIQNPLVFTNAESLKILSNQMGRK